MRTLTRALASASLVLACSEATAADCARLIRKRDYTYGQFIALEREYPATVRRLEECLDHTYGDVNRAGCIATTIARLYALTDSASVDEVMAVWTPYLQAYDRAKECEG
ncbi:hypothetical protein DES42_10452 [Zavarzinia compransoris]|uniref:Rap1a immunity protein domain-containing protein n=2 Tax=Zavarzinia compransoris TaxID=1264899 RepID=A0A317E9S0_9PROT|nr:hypothetical protein DKG75_02450 [Zavarzinia compransoris]TDP45971.1 hypothetical protein DES42_10452 [Zavarzinia compransoris]